MGAQPTRDESGKFVKAGAGSEAPVEEVPTDETFTITHKGRQVTLPVDRLKSLASKGFDYEQKMASIKNERDTIKSEGEGYDAYKQYKEYMTENPGIAQLVGDVLEEYEATGVVPGVMADHMAMDEGGTGTGQVGNSKLEREVRELRDQWANAQAQHSHQTLSQQLAEAVGKNPILARVSDQTYQKYGRDLALEKLASMVQPDPSTGALPSSEDIEAYADAVATEFAMTSETLGGGSDVLERKAEEAERFTSEPPSGSPPPAPTQSAPSFSAKDLKSGNLAREAAQFLASRMT